MHIEKYELHLERHPSSGIPVRRGRADQHSGRGERHAMADQLILGRCKNDRQLRAWHPSLVPSSTLACVEPWYFSVRILIT